MFYSNLQQITKLANSEITSLTEDNANIDRASVMSNNRNISSNFHIFFYMYMSCLLSFFSHYMLELDYNNSTTSASQDTYLTRAYVNFRKKNLQQQTFHTWWHYFTNVNSEQPFAHSQRTLVVKPIQIFTSHFKFVVCSISSWMNTAQERKRCPVDE